MNIFEKTWKRLTNAVNAFANPELGGMVDSIQGPGMGPQDYGLTIPTAMQEFEAGPTISNTWPGWERVTPRYPDRSVMTDIQQGYRKNEVVFSCVQYKMNTLGEYKLKVVSDDGENEQEDLPKHECQALLKRPNQFMGQREMLKLVQMYLDITGMAILEIEFNNLGEPLALWPMNPLYCSFYRGLHSPIETIRYLYPGMPPVYVPTAKCITLFENDPLYPGVVGLSRVAVAMDIIASDNAMTGFLADFFRRGTMALGILKTPQKLNQGEANAARDRFVLAHGGAGNWTAPAVLGSDLEFQSITPALKDIAPEVIDARAEARICMTMQVSPIIVNARIGVATTYNNYAEARKAHYEAVTEPTVTWIADEMSQQLLPHYNDGEMPDDVKVVADGRHIKALQEDRTAKFARASQAWNDGWATLNEAREEAELDPIDDEEGDKRKNEGGGNIPPQLAGFTGQDSTTPPQFEKPTATGEKPFENTTDKEGQATGEAAQDEEDNAEEVTKALAEWRREAIEVVRNGASRDSIRGDKGREGVPFDIWGAISSGLSPNNCKSVGDVRAIFAENWPKAHKGELAEAVSELAEALKGANA